MIGLGLIGLDLIGLGLIGLGLKSLGLIGLTRPYRTKWFYLTKRLNKCFHMLKKLMEILRPVINFEVIFKIHFRSKKISKIILGP